jgi:hypothetical protein
MALPEIVLMILVWIVVAGFVTFCILYALLKPWRDSMGKHVLFFMLALAVAFIYSLVAPHLERMDAIKGWTIVIGAIAFVIWWRVIKLIKFQVQNQEILYDIIVKIKSFFKI